MARAYCHKVIKLSPVIQSLAPEKEVVCNVHGVRDRFLEVGDQYQHKVSYFIEQRSYEQLVSLLQDKRRNMKKDGALAGRLVIWLSPWVE